MRAAGLQTTASAKACSPNQHQSSRDSSSNKYAFQYLLIHRSKAKEKTACPFADKNQRNRSVQAGYSGRSAAFPNQ